MPSFEQPKLRACVSTRVHAPGVGTVYTRIHPRVEGGVQVLRLRNQVGILKALPLLTIVHSLIIICLSTIDYD